MGSQDIARYVIMHPASGIYRYYRRVPTQVAHLDKRVHINNPSRRRASRKRCSAPRCCTTRPKTFGGAARRQ